MSMSGFNPYAAGHKVYRGGSSAAHMGGGLDPMGYIEREINNARGKGGMDTRRRNRLGGRSGWAQAALLRQKKNKGKTGKAPIKKAAPKPTPVAKPAAPGAPQQQSVIAQDSIPAARTPIISSPTGQLSLDSESMFEEADAVNTHNLNRIQLDQQEADINQQYAVGQRDVGIQQTRDRRTDLNQFAGRGLARSSGYGQEVTDSATEFQNMLSDLLSQKNSAIGTVNASRLQNDTFLTSARSAIARRQAERAAQEAADRAAAEAAAAAAPQDPMPEPTEPLEYSVPGAPPAVKKAAAKAHKGRKGKGKGYKGKRPGPG